MSCIILVLFWLGGVGFLVFFVLFGEGVGIVMVEVVGVVGKVFGMILVMLEVLNCRLNFMDGLRKFLMVLNGIISCFGMLLKDRLILK